MAFNDRITNPQDIPVQVNFKIPFWLRELVVKTADKRGVSQAELFRTALTKDLEREAALDVRSQAPAPR